MNDEHRLKVRHYLAVSLNDSARCKPTWHRLINYLSEIKIWDMSK